MKLTLFTLIIALGAYGCGKCGTCTTTTVTTVAPATPGYPQTVATSFEACGDERDVWDGDVKTSTATVGSITATSVATTVCE